MLDFIKDVGHTLTGGIFEDDEPRRPVYGEPVEGQRRVTYEYYCHKCHGWFDEAEYQRHYFWCQARVKRRKVERPVLK